MSMIKAYDFPVCFSKISPPSFYFDIGRKHKLSVFINGSLCDFIAGSKSEFLFELFTCDSFPITSDIDSFSFPWSGDVLAMLLCHVKPFFFTFTAKISFNDKITAFLNENSNVINWIISRIQTNEKRLVSQFFTEFDCLLKECYGTILTMLFSFTEFEIDCITFSANVGHHGSITIISFIGTRNTFFAGFWIIHWCYINIYRYETIGKDTGLNFVSKEHPDIFIKNQATQTIANVIHTLTKRFLWRNTSGDSQCSLIKSFVVIHFMDCLKIRFSHTKHSYVSKDDITILNLMLRTIFCNIHAVEPFGKITLSKNCADNR